MWKLLFDRYLANDLQLREQSSNYTKFPFNPKRVWNQLGRKDSAF